MLVTRSPRGPHWPTRGSGIRSATPWLLLALGVLSSFACDSDSSSGPEVSERTLVILYTNDEHGWIEEAPETDGAAKLLGLWKSAEGYGPGGDFLVLSGGDNWTGPAISTWFQGESTVEVMNGMGYDASSIGNHEFDFSIETLRKRAAEADFPFVSSNIRWKGTNEVPDFAEPFVLENVNGIRVGLVGLTTTTTPWSTFPAHVSELEFIPYRDALEEWVPRAWDAGADLVVVLAHICHDEMLSVLPTARELGVSVLTGGHCNEVVGEVRDGVALVVGGWRFDRYGRVEVRIDENDGTVIQLQSTTRANSGGSPDPAVQSVVTTWQQAAAAELSDVIGYASQAVPDGSPALHNLVTDSWLFAYPTADIVMTNSGGVRQGIPTGDITRGTVVGVLPFQNFLVELELTGSAVVDCLTPTTIVAGMTTTGGYLHADGTPLKMDSTYHVLTTDYLYSLDGYNFQVHDPTPYHTGISYHQPTVDYLQWLGTSPADPLDAYLDSTRRR